MSDTGTSPVIPGSQANHSRPVLWLITLVAVGLSLFQLYSAGIEPLGLFYQRSIHLMMIMMLAFLMFPLLGPKHDRGIVTGLIDTVFFAGALLTGGYLVLFLDEIINRAGFWSQTDILVGCIATLTVLEAARRAVGLGMTVIVEADGRLAGIFTDGDLRRALDKGVDVRETRIDEVMTVHGKTANAEMLAAEALKIMEDHKISSLVVIDEQELPIGALNMHDLLRAGVM